MTEFLIYQGKAAIALAVFYMFYRLLLSKETFHRFNRIVLLSTAALSFILPFCVITIRKVVTMPSMTPVQETVTGMPLETMTTVHEASAPIWPALIVSIFAIGAICVITTSAISIIKVMDIIRSGSNQQLESGETLVITETDTAPFSWMKYIVISREDYESGYSQILTHEKAHIALRHSLDILFVDMITALQWFNPAIWMLKSDLRAIHEFEADDAVLRSGANVKEYQYLLIRKAVSKSGYSVANSFNHSTLKARITMMLNKKSSRLSAWKALYVIPLVGISLAATAETKVDYQYEDQQTEAAASTTIDKDSKKIFKEKNMTEGHFIIDEEAGSVTMVYFDHEGNEMRATHLGLNLSGKDTWYFVNGNMATPKAFEMRLEEEDVVTLNAYMKNGGKIRGAVLPNNNYATGTWDVNKHPDEQEAVYIMDGKQYKVREGKYVEIKEPQNDEEKPVPDVYIDGKKATSEDLKALDKSNMNGSVGPDGTLYISTEKQEESATQKTEYDTQNRMASFQGGTNAEFSKWVQENIRYPEGATKEGRVSVSFTVSETGKVTNVKVLRGVESALDAEAVRAIKSSPEWAPALKDGKPIAIKMILPVDFKK